MPLTSESPRVLHILQTVLLIAISALFFPVCTFIAILARLISPWTKTTKHIVHHQKWRLTSSPTFRPRTVLVTGVGMSKGLVIARAFYRAGHRVIGADFEPYRIPVCGRFSVALNRFYRLTKPSPGLKGSGPYVQDLLAIVKRENVELWVSCSGVASAVEDGEAAEAVEKLTNCKAMQFGVDMTELLHEKHSFIDNTQRLGLNVPETHLVTSVDDVMKVLYPGANLQVNTKAQRKEFIMKSVGLDDSIRADMTLLPRATKESTEQHVLRLKPSSSRPFVLQQYINGPEYCTHSIVIKGKVKAFVACRSAELLMHYKALPPTSILSRSMLEYTQTYAEKMGEAMTGHFSIDFLLDDRDQQEDVLQKIYPIECNPRAHTAAVLFAEESEGIAEVYLSLLDDQEGISDGRVKKGGIVVPSTRAGYYWIGHDIVTRALIPLLQFLLLKISLSDLFTSWAEMLDHLRNWRDGAFEIWDPWPAWELYCVYWPLMFACSIITGRHWSRCNVSTTKIFGC